MSRVIYGSQALTDTTAKYQLNTARNRAFAVVFKPRVTNAGTIHLGTDSDVSTTNGLALLAGDREDWSFSGSHDATKFYALATDSNDVLDWVMEVAN